MIRHIPCGDFAFMSSEELACKRMKSCLSGPEWDHSFLLTNCYIAPRERALPYEIDMIILDTTGVSLIEIKHWDWAWHGSNSPAALGQAHKLNEKAKKIGDRLRKSCPYVEFVPVPNVPPPTIYRFRKTTYHDF